MDTDSNDATATGSQRATIDRDVVDRWLERLQSMEWGVEGSVEMLVETPKPHRHAVRERVDVVMGKGFSGDHDRKSHYRGAYVPGREVTAIAAEVLEVCDVEPSLVGDNLITRAIDLRILKEGDLLRTGEVILERSERTHRPCATFRSRSSPEAFALVAREGLRGALFTVRQAGVLRRGDRIEIVSAEIDSAMEAG